LALIAATLAIVALSLAGLACFFSL